MIGFSRLQANVELISTLSSSSSSAFVEALFGVESGSFWSDLLTSAKLVILPSLVTFALKVNTAVAPLAILATVPVNTPTLSVKVDELT